MDDFETDLFLERFHAADILKGDARPFDPSIRQNGGILHRSTETPFNHVAFVRIGVDAETFGKVRIG